MRDGGESISDCLVRECAEETGLTGRIEGGVYLTPNDPWKSNEVTGTALLLIDGKTEINRNSKQILDTDETILIEVIENIEESMIEKIEKLAKEKGYVIGSSLAKFMMGFRVAQMIQPKSK